MPLTRDSEEGKRILYLTKPSMLWLNPPGKHPDGVGDDALSKADAVLTAYVRGRELIEDQDLKHLEKHEIPNDREVWEFRTGLDLKKHQLRMFGWFPMANHFVMICGKRRGDLNTDASWERAFCRVVDERRLLLPDVPLFRGMSYADYIN